jgi:hypothetical protein
MNVANALTAIQNGGAVLGAVPVSIEVMEGQSRGGFDADNPPQA